MDHLDVRILRVMAFRPLEHAAKHPDALKASHVARHVGATAETVRARVRAMEEAGVIVGYQAVPNLALFGLSAGGYYFRLDDASAKEAAVERMLEVPRLMEVHDFLGGGVCVDFAYRDAADRGDRVRALARAAGVPGGTCFYERPLPPVPRQPSDLDWRILRGLRDQPLASPGALGDGLGVTPRTVRRRVERLVQEGTVVIAPRLDPSRAVGLLLVEMLCFLEEEDDAETMRAITHALQDHHLHGYVPASRGLGNFNLLLFAPSPADVEALRQRAEALPGVRRVEAWLIKRFVDTSGWVDDLLAAAEPSPTP